MATELTVQSEKSFQKQPHVFLCSKVKNKSATKGKGGKRWYKDVGLGFRTPKTAIEGSYIGECDYTKFLGSQKVYICQIGAYSEHFGRGGAQIHGFGDYILTFDDS